MRGRRPARPGSKPRRDEIGPDAARRGKRRRVLAAAEAILDEERAKSRGASAQDVGVERVADAEHALGSDPGIACAQPFIDRCEWLAAEDRTDGERVGETMGEE